MAGSLADVPQEPIGLSRAVEGAFLTGEAMKEVR